MATMSCTITLTPEAHPDWDSPPTFTLSYPYDDNQNKTLELGRGEKTKVYDTIISRRVCTVEFLEQEAVLTSSNKRRALSSVEYESTNIHSSYHEAVPILRMHRAPDKHKVEINGQKVSTVNIGDYVFLNDKDTLLIHSTRPFRYKVTVKRSPRSPLNDPQIQDCQEVIQKAGPAFTTALHVSTDTHMDVAQKAVSNLCDEIKCPICMEIYVESHAANPCGHLFCGKCVRDWIGKGNPKDRLKQPIECHSCRMMIHSFTLVRQYDSMIWNLLLCRPFPQADLRGDLLVFLKRCGRELSSLSPEERECLFGSKEGLSDLNGEQTDGA